MNKKNLESKTETIITSNNRSDVEEIIEFVLTLNPEQKRTFRAFVQGAKFTMGINQSQNSIMQ